MDPGSAYYDDVGGGFAPSEVNIKCRSRIHDQMAVSVAVVVDCALRLRKVLNLSAKSKIFNAYTSNERKILQKIFRKILSSRGR